MIFAPILVIALLLLLWQMGVFGGGGGGGGGEAPSEPGVGEAQAPGQGAPGMPGVPPGGAGMPIPPVAGMTPPSGASAPEGAGQPGTTGAVGAEGGTSGQPTATAAESGPSLWKARTDPFTPFRKTVTTRVPVNLWPTTTLVQAREAVVPPVVLRKQVIIKRTTTTAKIPGLRVAGILYNGRAYAIFESNGVAQVVRPGDQVPEGKILAISPDRMVLLDNFGERREIKLEAAEAGTYTTPGGYLTPGEPVMPMGPAGPPMPGGAPMPMG